MSILWDNLDPYLYPYEVLRLFTRFSQKRQNPLKIKGSAYTVLQHFHPGLKFKSLLPRQPVLIKKMQVKNPHFGADFSRLLHLLSRLARTK